MATEQEKVTIRTIQALGRQISSQYLGEPWDMAADSVGWAMSSLRAIIRRALKTAENFTACRDTIREELGQYPGIYDLVDFPEIVYDAKIRRNFGKALKAVEHGSDLSHALGYGFSKEDLRSLAALHKAGKYQEKIEELLTDCDFHQEAAAMYDGDYSMFGL